MEDRLTDQLGEINHNGGRPHVCQDGQRRDGLDLDPLPAIVIRAGDVETKSPGKTDLWFKLNTVMIEGLARRAPRWNQSFHNFRFLVCLIAGLMQGSMLYMRLQITVSMLQMVDHAGLFLQEHPDKTLEDFEAEGFTPGGDFLWNSEIQQTIYMGYMLSYTIPQVACTKLGTQIGSRLAMPICLSISILSVMLTPYFAYWGWQWVFLLRLVNGLGASAVLPLNLSLIERWTTRDEVLLGLTLIQTVQALSVCVQPVISGYLCSFHWAWSFYVPCVFILFLCITWLLVITNEPEENPFISQQELDFLERQKRIIVSGEKEKPTIESKEGSEKQEVARVADKKAEEQRPYGLMDLIRLPVFYRHQIIWFCNCNVGAVFFFLLPKYIRHTMKSSTQEAGYYCTIMQFGVIIACCWPYPCLQLLMSKRLSLNLARSRQVMMLMITIITIASLVYVGLLHENQVTAILIARSFHTSQDMLVTGSMMNNFSQAGLTALAFSLINTMGNLSSCATGVLIGWVLDAYRDTNYGWTYIFIACAGLQLIQAILFFTFANSEPVDMSHIDARRRKLAQDQTAYQEDHRVLGAGRDRPRSEKRTSPV